MGNNLPTFAVVRVGDGSAPLSGASQPVYLDRFATDGMPVGASTNLSTVVGNNQPFSLSGSATSEGALSLSTNGQYLALAGYAVAPGLASVSGTDVGAAAGAVNRVVARVDAMGNVNTTTIIDSAFSKSNPRSVASMDGTAFWVTGNGTPAGVQYIPFGQTGSTTVLAAPNNTRTAGIFGGQLYAASGSAGFASVFAVGMGLPTATGATTTLLTGLPTAAQSPYAFVFFDRDATPGADTLYIADDKAPGAAMPGGIQKYTLVGGTWTLQSTFNAGITTGVRGLTGLVTGATVTLIATTTESSQNHVVVFVDDGSMNPTGTLVATAGMNSVFRGVALTPQ
ncbi:MAG: hypothetical protein ACMG6S_10930 [Byssovorax sp.]